MSIITPDPIFPLEKYKKHDMLVEGIKTTEQKKKYLVKHLYENQESFKIRVERSAYRNFASPIVSAYSSAIYAQSPIRNLPDQLKEFIEDVDKNSEDADNFFSNVAYQASKRGLHYVFIALPETKPFNLEEAKLIGHRPYFVSIDSRNVLRYNKTYAIIRNVFNDSVSPFQDYEVVEEYSIWYNDKWEKYQVLENELVKVDEGVNSLGFIPLVPFYFKKKIDGVGLSAIEDVDELIINLFRKDSELDKALFDSAIPLLFLKGVSKDEAEGFVKSTENAFATNSERADAKYVEPSGISFEYLFKSIEALENSIREIGLRTFKPTSAQVQSAESKNIDKESFDNIVRNFAKNCEDAENLCWYIFAIAGNFESKNINVNYITSSDVNNAISEQTLNILEDMTLKKLISKETLYKVLEEQNILPEGFDAVEEANVIKAENYNAIVPTLNL